MSGIAATGVAFAIAFLAVGQPVWEWRLETATEVETWSYKLFAVDHVLRNKTTGNETTIPFTYYDLQGQSRMSALFVDLGRWFAITVLVATAGLGLSVATLLKKLRGIFAGLAHLLACAAILYACLNFVFAIPIAAVDLPAPTGDTIADFRGAMTSSEWTLTWTPLAGWFLLLGVGLVLAWTSSEMWHVRIPKRSVAASPAPRPAVPSVAPAVKVVPTEPPKVQEPVIDEVFVISPSGLLVKHMSRSLLSDKDRDVVGGMISVVSNFVKDAFTEKRGDVQEIQLGGHRFIIYNHGGLVLAVLVGKGETEPILHRLKHLASLLTDRYGDRLLEWDGEPLDGIEDELVVLWEPFFVPPPPAE